MCKLSEKILSHPGKLAVAYVSRDSTCNEYSDSGNSCYAITRDLDCEVVYSDPQ